MKKAISEFLVSLKTPQIVALYNLANPEAPVKKFSARPVAETRMARCMETAPEYFYKRLAIPALKLGMQLPVPEGMVAAVLPKPPTVEAVLKAAKKEDAMAKDDESSPVIVGKKQIAPPHLNLRCPTCGYYAKSTPAWLAKGRLVCPADPKHGRLLTAEERGEKRGR